MACNTLAIVGESASGKTTSLRNLNPTETFIISTTAKPLSFKGWRKKYRLLTQDKETKEFLGNYYISSDYSKIIKTLDIINKRMPHIKQVIIDDFQYMLAFEFVDRAAEKGYDKFNELAQHFIEIIRYNEQMRPDCFMIFCLHSETNDDVLNPRTGIKTLGKLLKEKVTVEGLFTYILFTDVNINVETGIPEYRFLTNTDGNRIAKTSIGMFEEKYIDNDLAKIIPIINAYDNEE